LTARARQVDGGWNNKVKTSTGTVDRVALLLKLLAESEGDAAVAQVAERLKLPTSTTHRLLGLLVNTGLAERAARPGTYRVGLEFLRLGGLVVSRTEVTTVAEGFMQQVAEATGETCILNLYVPSEQKALIAKVIHGRHPLRYEAQLYGVSSLCFGATGRGLLAFLPDDVIHRVLAKQEVSPITGRALSNARVVRRELRQIKERGYAISRGQRTPGAVGLAAPVFKGAAVVVGSLCITMPETRFVQSEEPRLARVLVEQASKLSATLGHGPAKT
jgi:DNA-binding IclR family transcriptional regulator